MKRFLSILMMLCLFSTAVFAADDEGDEYEDDYVYTANGAGDRFVKVDLGGFFPLNFNGQLYVGGCAGLGFYKFVNSWFAFGGDFMATYNVSVGNKTLLMIPFTGGVMFQPTINKLEFPVFLNAGLGYESWQNYNYFPSLVAKVSAGAYYRISDSFSVGASGTLLWVSQWNGDNSHASNGLFANATIGLRYHF